MFNIIYVDEDFTRKSTCLLCDAKVDPKFEVQICSTCATNHQKKGKEGFNRKNECGLYQINLS